LQGQQLVGLGQALEALDGNETIHLEQFSMQLGRPVQITLSVRGIGPDFKNDRHHGENSLDSMSCKNRNTRVGQRCKAGLAPKISSKQALRPHPLGASCYYFYSNQLAGTGVGRRTKRHAATLLALRIE